MFPLAVVTLNNQVVDEIRRAYVCGVRSPEKLRPARLTEPTFRPPSQVAFNYIIEWPLTDSSTDTSCSA